MNITDFLLTIAVASSFSANSSSSSSGNMIKKIFRKKFFLCKQLPLIINSLCGYIMLKENFGLKFPYTSYTKAKFQNKGSP